MDGLKVFWTQTAKRQRDHIFEYWNNKNKSKSYSTKLNLAIRERIQLLKKQPEFGKKIYFKNIRAVSMRHYSIIYKINQLNIIIIGFWDNRQDSEKLLNFLRNA
ncbi:hypothetical protein IMCC3317_19740 [Kordia antarctica]|uniref:Uncharacterized protein n=1 Tax=Kordia antarctica TaxID=1218801 RepID=A0A7L4ZJC2_9FLAO|nr:type II toxin-antitoxin system RelE/ParE family toxin [Kordia antarctica]QHI36611.1 hypothetical protein IMCC3317_19740 [Kordia antarctica]